MCFDKASQLYHVFAEKERCCRDGVFIKLIVNMLSVDFLIVVKIRAGIKPDIFFVNFLIKALNYLCVAVYLITGMAYGAVFAAGKRCDHTFYRCPPIASVQ